MPQIVTERLILRAYRAGEAHLLHRLMADPRVFFWLDRPVGLADAKAVLTERAYLLDAGLGWWAAFRGDALERDGTPVFVGQVILQPRAGVAGREEIEVGWHVVPEHWGRGYAGEAAGGVIARAFRGTLAEVCALVLPDNARSLRVIHRLGFADRGWTIHVGRPHRYFVMKRSEHGAGRECAGAAEN